MKIIRGLRTSCIEADYFSQYVEYYEFDLIKALNLLLQPFIDKRYAPALFQLGNWLPFQNRYISDTEAKALSLFRLAAEQGYAPAHYELSRLNQGENKPAKAQKYPPALPKCDNANLPADIVDFMNDEFKTGDTLLRFVPQEVGEFIFKYPNDSFWTGFDWEKLYARPDGNEEEYTKVIHLMKADLHGFKPDQLGSLWFNDFLHEG